LIRCKRATGDTVSAEEFERKLGEYT